MKYICCGCSCEIPPKEVASDSQLYGATSEMVLCEKCSKAEDDACLLHGNDHPEMLAIYIANLQS